MPMMTGVAPAEVGRVFALIEMIADPAKAKAVLDEIVSGQAALDEREAKVAAREAAIGPAEQATKAAADLVAVQQERLKVSQQNHHRAAEDLVAQKKMVENREREAAASKLAADEMRGEQEKTRRELDRATARLAAREQQVAEAEAAMSERRSKLAAALQEA